MKKYVLMFFAALLFMTMPVLLLHGGAAGAGVRSGLELAYRSVLPALFPAMVVCGMIGETAEYLPLPPALAIWINGHLCGFPLGIKTLARAYHRGLLTRRQTIRLSACCANASPAFLVLYAGQSVLGSRQEGILLLLGKVMISLGVAVCTGALEDTPTLPAEERPLLVVARYEDGRMSEAALVRGDQAGLQLLDLSAGSGGEYRVFLLTEESAPLCQAAIQAAAP